MVPVPFAIAGKQLTGSWRTQLDDRQDVPSPGIVTYGYDYIWWWLWLFVVVIMITYGYDDGYDDGYHKLGYEGCGYEGL